MKKLFAMLAVALFSLSIVGCENTNKGDVYTLTADKTTVTTGDQIVFTLTGPIEGKMWGTCDFLGCRAVTFTNNKYTYIVPEVTEDMTYDMYMYIMNSDPEIASNTVKITYKKAQ